MTEKEKKTNRGVVRRKELPEAAEGKVQNAECNMSVSFSVYNVKSTLQAAEAAAWFVERVGERFPQACVSVSICGGD